MDARETLEWALRYMQGGRVPKHILKQAIVKVAEMLAEPAKPTKAAKTKPSKDITALDG